MRVARISNGAGYFSSNMPPTTEELAPPPEEVSSEERTYSEDNTSEVSVDFFGREVKAGDTEQIKIVSVDEGTGLATIKCVTEPEAEDGIGEMASKFDRPKQSTYE